MKRIIWLTLGLVLMAAGLSGCYGGTKAGPPAPEAPKTKTEGDLAFLTISEEACHSLKIKSEKARTALVQELAELTGWIAIPQGQEVILTAPHAGYVQKAKSGQPGPIAGKDVGLGQELFQLDPVLSPVEELQLAALKRDVDSELTKAQIGLKVADKELVRIQDLHKQGLRGQQEVDKAQERVDQAHESVNTAKDKQKLFVAKQAVSIKAPLAGTVLTVHANPGEFVAKSAPLVTIADLAKLWVRVPVPEHDMPAVKPNQPVTVALKGSKGLGAKNAHAPDQVFSATPVALVPQVDLQKHTVDLFYELVPHPPKEMAQQGIKPVTNQTSAKKLPFVKDQMVTVLIPLGKKKEETVVPYSAVVFDNQGGAWIYLDKGEKKVGNQEFSLFERRPVQLGPTINGDIVIRPPLSAKAVVVTEGAAKLFSSEFHSAPGVAPVEIDDDD